MLRTIIITIKIMIRSPDSFSSVPGEEKKFSREKCRIEREERIRGMKMFPKGEETEYVSKNW